MSYRQVALSPILIRLLAAAVSFRISRSALGMSLVRLFLFLWIAGAFVATAAAATFPLRDSKFPAYELAGKVFWLDNEKILFSGYDPASYPTPGGSRDFKLGMYVWDTGNGKVRPYPQIAGELCYYHGYISYVALDPDRPGEFLHYSGKVESEKPVRYVKGRGRNEFSCRYYDSYPDWLPPDRHVRLLHDDHGYLDMGLPRGQGWSPENSPVTFYRRGNKQGIRLPFGQREISAIRYSAFNDSYLLYGGYIDKAGIDNNWPQGKPQPVWTLRSDGTISEVHIPPGPWNSSGSTMYLLTKKGVFIVSHNFASLEDAGAGGGYMFDGAKVQKLVTGQLNAPGVSPDGCKVAFVFSPNAAAGAAGFRALKSGGDATQTLRMIDVCAGERR